MSTDEPAAAALPERIDADGLTIRRWQPTDASAMTAMITASVDHLRPWMAWAHDEPLTTSARLRQFARWDRYWASGAGVVYAVFDDDAPIGGCALHRRVGPGGVDIGYWLAATATGHGHGTRIAAALTRAACALPDVTFVLISHASHNRDSAAVAPRLGYVRAPGDGPHGDQVTTWRHDCGTQDATTRAQAATTRAQAAQTNSKS